MLFIDKECSFCYLLSEMFGSVALSAKSLDSYRPVVGGEVITQLRQLAKPLAKARVLHLSVTSFGTGVAEYLHSLVPLMNDLGLNCQWQVIRTAEEFTEVNKAMYNALGGIYTPWSQEKNQTWLRYNAMNASLFDEDFDFVVIHDPQPAGVLACLGQPKGRFVGKWVWHCHLDLSDAQDDVWDLLCPCVDAFDEVIFDLEEYKRSDIKAHLVSIIPPAIDPLGPKNMALPYRTITSVLQRFGIDAHRPLLCQISPFDVWHDPLGVIEAFRWVKEREPRVQLALVATMTSDDPETRGYYRQIAQLADENRDIFVLCTLNQVGNVEMNVLQRASAVVVQKSLRKGFGLGVAEALWKERAVVAGAMGGIPRQIIPGQTGYLAKNTAECAEKILYLLQNPGEARRLGKAGKEHIRQHFLITHSLQNYLTLFQRLALNA